VRCQATGGELQLEQLGAAEGIAAAGEGQQQGQQVATAEVLKKWLLTGEVTEGLEQGMACVGMLLERQLEALGVVGAELSFRKFVFFHRGFEAHRAHPVVQGRVGGCAVEWALWAESSGAEQAAILLLLHRTNTADQADGPEIALVHA
jgi:hypothetical protein